MATKDFPKKEKKKVSKKTHEWCEKENVGLGVIGFPWQGTKVPVKTVRCPKCKKRFKPYIFECHDPGCLHYALPRHKK